MSHTCGNTGRRQELPCINCDCESSARPASCAPTVEAARLMGETGGEVTEDERLAFEAWMAGHCWALGAEWDGESYRGASENGDGVCLHAMRTRMMWAAWRDRAALAHND